MAMLELGPGEGLYHEFAAPAEGGRTFVFVNALTGSTAMWQDEIGPRLRDAGHGTLVYDFRGQAQSPFRPETALDADLIVGDLLALLKAVAPPRPLLVGLSIGGLFAARAWLAGGQGEGLVLINTLRRPGPRLDWINRAMIKAVAAGGTRLLLDMYMPLLVNQERLDEICGDFLDEAPYEPLDPAHGHCNLMTHAATADWDLPYEDLDLPTLVITGLQDRVFYDEADVAALAARLPRGRRLDMADAGHLIPAERPAATAAALLDFAAWL